MPKTRTRARQGADGKSDEEITAWWNRWLDADVEYFARDIPKEYARLVLDGSKPFNDGVFATINL